MNTEPERVLIVIDVQMEYFDGALPVTHPNDHLAQITSAMDAATGAGVPVVLVRHHQADPESPIFRKDSEAWKLHPEIQQRPHDHLIDKQLPGSFTGTDLQTWITDRSIDTVCIAGHMTHMCCDTTARQAFHLGHNVEFLSDATGTLDVENAAGRASAEQLQTSTLVAQQMFISDVVDTATWQGRLRGTK